LLGKGEELSQRTADNDVAMTTFLAWMDFDVAYKRTESPVTFSMRAAGRIKCQASLRPIANRRPAKARTIVLYLKLHVC